VEQVLIGRYADGLVNIKGMPDRIGFDPFHWHSMAVWILTQMKRWKHIDGDVDYRKLAEQIYLAAECDKLSCELGYPAHDRTCTTHTIMGQVFDSEKPEAYVQSFAIHS
jgi:nitrate/nitrite transport system substrate-binding protein